MCSGADYDEDTKKGPVSSIGFGGRSESEDGFQSKGFIEGRVGIL